MYAEAAKANGKDRKTQIARDACDVTKVTKENG